MFPSAETFPMGSENGSTFLTNFTNEPKDLLNKPVVVATGTLILTITLILGVPGNLFIIWSILARARKRSVTTLLILNLACADGCLMCLTVFFIIYIGMSSWIFGGVMCKLLFYLCNTNMYASVLIITLMSLHRLVAVVQPRLLPTCSRRKTVLLVLGGLWVVVFILALPALIFRKVLKKNGSERLLCSIHHEKSQYVLLQYTLETVLGFLIPYIIIVSSYVCILRHLRQTKFQRRTRSENLIQAIVVTFCIFWLPYNIINVVQVMAELTHEGSKVRGVLDSIWLSSRTIASTLAFTSSCANPVLYALAGRSYIKAEGLAFMARLFEGTVVDYNTWRSRQMRRTAVLKSQLENTVTISVH